MDLFDAMFGQWRLGHFQRGFILSDPPGSGQPGAGGNPRLEHLENPFAKNASAPSEGSIRNMRSDE